MPKKIYVKDTSFDPIYREVSKGFYAKTRIMPSLLVFSGLFVFVTQVILPLLVFKTQDKNIGLVDNATVLGRAAGFYEFEFDELGETQPNEFKESLANNRVEFLESEYLPRQSEEVKGAETKNVPSYFYITIPKLGIKDAAIETNAKSLNPNTALGHYPGTGLPGEVGNAFVFGHSVLPWFFNPNNYKTIFSTLGKLEEGDEFYVNFNNRDYTYLVESKVELIPDKVKPLAELKPRYLNESTMVLMTCSPPGTKLKRLMINAVLVEN